MDEIDQAQGINEDFQTFALAEQRRNREPGNYTGTDCIDCGEEIPIKRRQIIPGCRRCITCQEELEINLHRRAL